MKLDLDFYLNSQINKHFDDSFLTKVIDNFDEEFYLTNEDFIDSEKFSEILDRFGDRKPKFVATFIERYIKFTNYLKSK